MKACLLACSLVLAGCGVSEPVGVLRACLGEDDLPRSHAGSRSGFDVDVAQFLAEELNHSLEIVWLEADVPTEIESTDINFGPLLRGRCDMQLSIPGADALGAHVPRLVLGTPYYGTAFELIPSDAPTDWDTLASYKLAVRANSVAHLVIDARGIEWTMRRDNASVVTAIRTGEASAAIIWGPDLALFDSAPSDTFEPPAVLRWNQHIVTRADAAVLRGEIDAQLRLPSVQSQIRRLQRKHRIPDRAPFESTHEMADLKRG